MAIDLDAIERLLRNLDRQLPNMPDPEASAHDVCTEVEITWLDWAIIRAARQALQDRDKDNG